jgi:hypothetical protein
MVNTDTFVRCLAAGPPLRLMLAGSEKRARWIKASKSRLPKNLLCSWLGRGTTFQNEVFPRTAPIRND